MNQMDTVSTSSRSAGPVAALACMCLLGLTLFAAAATIVLSLISVYIPPRDIAPVSTVSSGPQQVHIPLVANNNFPVGSSLDAASLSSVQNQMQSALLADAKTKNLASVNVISGVTANSTNRKRRQNNAISNTVLVIYELVFRRGQCAKRCQASVIALVNTLFEQISISLTATSTSTSSTISDDVVTADIPTISQYWSNLRAYQDNPTTLFSVLDTGLPDGCQVEQAHVLHRHASRYPTNTEYLLMQSFVAKIDSVNGGFTGPLSFLNTWVFQMGLNTLLIRGYSEGYASGANFWTKYGRILYNASVGQVRYNQTGQNTPLLRSNTLARVLNTARSWAAGFFGLDNATSEFTLLQMPLSNPNNTLASYGSCLNFANVSYGLFDGVEAFVGPLPYYLGNTSTRLSTYAPSGITFNVNDSFAMQSLCVYEYAAFGSSDFCSLFTLTEWKGYDYVGDLFLYNGFSFGQPAGRALGIGYLQELLARLQNQLINVSNSSVNSTLTSSPVTFPLNLPFYFDASHDLTIVDLIAALSLDYFRRNLSVSDFPPPADRHFRAGYITPFAARFVTEKIGCVSSNPTATNSSRTQYSPTQYGYNPSTATNKFIRMRINNAIVPMNTIRGGYCDIDGRTDGLCPLDKFLQSQANASALANYAYVCFDAPTFNASTFSGDGTFFATS